MDIWSLLLAVVVVLLGIAFLFMGYGLFRIILPIWAFFVGFGLGAHGMPQILGDGVISTGVGWVVGLVIGLVFALLAWFFYSVAIFILGASVGYMLGYGLIQAIGLGEFTSVAVGLVVAVVAAVLTQLLNVRRWLVLIFTAAGGATAIIAGVLLFFGNLTMEELGTGAAVDIIFDNWLWILAWIAMLVVGVGTQWMAGVVANEMYVEGY